MYRKSYYAKIIGLIKARPMSQREVRNELGLNEITIPGVSDNLTLGIEKGVLAYLGNQVSKKDAKLLLFSRYKIRWPEDAHQCYIYIPQTERFYKHLKRREDIDYEGILPLYRALEIKAMLQKVYYEDLKVLRADFKGRGQILTNLELKKKIARKRKEIKEFYNNRNKKDPNLKFLRLTPLMYWCRFQKRL
jgi:hypothetical protein